MSKETEDTMDYDTGPMTYDFRPCRVCAYNVSNVCQEGYDSLSCAGRQFMISADKFVSASEAEQREKVLGKSHMAYQSAAEADIKALEQQLAEEKAAKMRWEVAAEDYRTKIIPKYKRQLAEAKQREESFQETIAMCNDRAAIDNKRVCSLAMDAIKKEKKFKQQEGKYKKVATKLAELFPESSMEEMDAADFKDRAMQIMGIVVLAKAAMEDKL